MYHYVNNLQTRAGDALVGYYVKLKDSNGNYATLYADENSTPIISVSGVANAAKTDEEGMYDLWVADSIYDVEFFDTDELTTLVRRLPGVPLFGLDFYADALEAVQNAEDAAEDAEGFATAAQGSATTASVAAAQAEASATEAETAAAASNTDGIYPNEPTGRAAVGDGEYFWVPSTNGQTLYRRVDAGSSTQGPTIPSLGITGPRQYIKCTASTSGHSNNDYSITPVDATAVYTGDGTQYIWVWEAPIPNVAGSGSVSVTIKNGAGVTFLTLPLVKDFAGTTLDPSENSQGDLITARRVTAAENVAQSLLWLRPPDTTRQMAPWVMASGDLGKRGSSVRPLIYRKSGPNEHQISFRLDESKYGVGQSRRQSDEVRFVFQDLASFMSLLASDKVVSLNSAFSHIRGRSCHDLNMMFTNLDGGLVVDTGRSPTAIEPPMEGGKFGDDESLYKVSGVTHGWVSSAETTMTGTYADATTSGVDTNVDISPNAAVGYEFYGDKLVIELSMPCVNAAGDCWALQTHTVTIDPIADYQVKILSVYDFDDAVVDVTPGFIRGFGLIWAGTDIDRFRPITNGVPGSIVTIDTRDSASSATFGHPESVVQWHSDFDVKQITATNFAGVGKTHWLDSGAGYVAIDADTDYPSYYDSFEDYVKLRGALFGDHSGSPTGVDMSGKKIKTHFGFKYEVTTPQS